ncbi:14210_t:CDS:1 [Funneliformis geosporum]|uniref:8783_t:CDS:1 n=1 Tax=Funneliformis geosporum TaxID=1117311 RepID=A0A9W4WUZ6_9GLOM|nr:14210_t:CDS:1 [Funneliformis geosporum]CAI2174111.1 8783_t:CDS:1 [Funneliformis geosporum]
MNKRFFPFVILFLTIYLTLTYLICFPPNDQLVYKEQTNGNENDVKSSFSNPSTCSDPNGVVSNEERYMTYLPHSGFHNQRNSLENAVFLSWVLNRTLIMPPILFSKKKYIPHRPFDVLYNMLNGNLTNDIALCEIKGVEDQACKFTQLDWEELLNFEFIKKHIRYVHRNDTNFDVKELYSYLNITNPETQVYTLAEETRYDFQFYDDENTTQVSNDNFKFLVNLCSLQKRKDKLIHFGSVYHLLRFNLKNEDNIEFINSVRENMIINHPVLLNVGEKISEQLGGKGAYIGVHLRLGDNGLDRKFGEKAEENVDQIIKELLNELPTTPLDEDDVYLAKDLFPVEAITIDAKKCLRSIAAEQRHVPIIYLASDKPRKDQRLRKFFREFPCVFMLSSNFTKYLDALSKLKNPRDGALLFQYFVPFIDGIVAARGGKFIGTPESTFSDYVYRLHHRWVGS